VAHIPVQLKSYLQNPRALCYINHIRRTDDTPPS